MNPDQPKQLDARGLLCPEPIRLAELAIRQLSAGAILSVQATDPAAPMAVALAAAERKLRLLVIWRSDIEESKRCRYDGNFHHTGCGSLRSTLAENPR